MAGKVSQPFPSEASAFIPLFGYLFGALFVYLVLSRMIIFFKIALWELFVHLNHSWYSAFQENWVLVSVCQLLNSTRCVAKEKEMKMALSRNKKQKRGFPHVPSVQWLEWLNVQWKPGIVTNVCSSYNPCLSSENILWKRLHKFGISCVTLKDYRTGHFWHLLVWIVSSID